MICRKTTEGWIFVTQAAHAWAAGTFARNWGNDLFEIPGPKDALIIGTHLHDMGWAAWDANPSLSDDGLPVNFLGAGIDDTALMWRDAVQRVSLINAYSALLVSMHSVTIYEIRLERTADSPAEIQKIKRLIAEQEAVQSDLRQLLVEHPHYANYLDTDSLRSSYRILRICDILSLILCSDVYPDKGTIPDVPVSNHSENTTLSYELLQPYTLAINPNPFSTMEIQIAVEARQLDAQQFSSHADYHQQLQEAPWHPLFLKIIAR